MFYSHEVLTSRKYGVATVWLVATLGSKSNLKKINRKAILDVDVQKACHTIIDPAAPMALRLQGNLLYGVSRVYLQQCGYVLSDAQNAHNAMRMMLKVVKNAGLDPDAGKARPEQLVLADDPSFLPDFALPPPELLASLELPQPSRTPRSGESQSLTPFGSQNVYGTPEGPVGGLVLPSTPSQAMDGFQFAGDDGLGSVGGPSSMPGGEAVVEPLIEPDFGIDEDGKFFDFSLGNAVPDTPAAPGGPEMPSDAGASARVRHEHEEGQRAGDEQLGDPMDLDLPHLGDDLPEGDAFPTAVPEQAEDDVHAVDSTFASQTAAAPMRRQKRTPRVIPADETMELRNKDLADWNANYLQNMKEASRSKETHRALYQAKKNAEYWVWGAGIGGIGHRLLGAAGPTPFDRLYGDNLFELFTGVNRTTLKGTKRDRDNGIDDDTQGESRRVRPRPDDEEEQIGRGDEDEAMFMQGVDDEVELPRDAPVALDDPQMFSAMPWNISASVRGSSVVPRSAVTGRLGSVAGPSSMTGPPRGSRMVSASPLHGRGQLGELDALKSLEGDNDFGDLGVDDFGLPPGPSSDGPYAELGAISQPSFRVREALSAEGGNFLTFVSDAINEKRTRAQAGLQGMSDPLQAEAAGDVDEVLFEELLPPADSSRMVACQGLMMVLALGTRGMLNVRQDSDFGEIGLALTEKAQDAQLNERDEEHDEHEIEEGQGGEEQFAVHEAGPGAGEAEDDDQDSLYAP